MMVKPITVIRPLVFDPPLIDIAEVIKQHELAIAKAFMQKRKKQQKKTKS